MPRRIKIKKDRKKNLLTKAKGSRFSPDMLHMIDYKNPRFLAEFLTERGKIVSRRVSGNTRYEQNLVVEAIKRARHLALLPYSVTHAVRD